MRAAWASLLLLLAGCASDPPAASPPAPVQLSCLDPCGQSFPIEGLWEPHGAGSPVDPDHFVAVFKAQAPEIFTLVTRDGGQTWAEGSVVVGPSSPSPVLRRYTHTGDPVVAILPDGAVLASGLGHNVTRLPGEAADAGALRAGRAVFVARSMDGGLTFPEAAEVTAGAGQQLQLASPAAAQSLEAQYDSTDKEWLAVGPDGRTVLLAWTDIHYAKPLDGNGPFPGEPNTFDLMAAVSRDGGATWGEPVALEQDVVWAATHPAFARDGSMFVAYGNPFGGDLVGYTSQDGASWTRHAIGATGGQPIVRQGPGDRGLLMAYPDLADRESVPVLRSSTDGGATWGPATALAGPIGSWFVNVAMDAASDGTVLVSWYRETGDDAMAYEARAMLPNGTLTPTLVLAEGLGGPSGTVGDYMALLSASPGGGLVGWVAVGEDGARSLQFARLAVG